MKLSIILIDWNVRESFHSIEYLNNQTVNRKEYEIIWVEFYNKVHSKLSEYEKLGKLDKYIVLGNENIHYHKHIAWNEGFLQSSGDVIVLPDSDSMFSETFVENILKFFKNNENSFLSLDQVRNKNPKYFPFNYPSFQEILEDEFTENFNKESITTNGLTKENEKVKLPDGFFLRNYGACFSCKREDFIKFGGLDEFEGYRSYICGAYELIFRMKNGGLNENWLKNEFLIHTFHPWMKPGLDKMGPHLKHLSIISLKQFYDGNKLPLLENREIKKLRINGKKRNNKFLITFYIENLKQENLYLNYYSIEKSTKYKFKLIVPEFIDTNCFKNVENVKIDNNCLSFGEKADYFVLLRDNYLLNELEVDKFIEKSTDFCFLKVFNSIREGFWFEESTNCGEIQPFIVKVDDNKVNISKILKKKNCLSKESPIVYNWNVNTFEANRELDLLTDKILNLEFSINNENKITLINEAKVVLKEIEKQPNEFINYFFLKRLSIMEFYRFLSVFKKNKLFDDAISGYCLLSNGVDFLKSKYSREIPKEFNWLKVLLMKDLDYFKGGCEFHVGECYFYLNYPIKAKLHFRKCLNNINNHQKASDYLKKL